MRGQAAIEYLMNYGWAVFVLAVVISAILFTGIFNPNYFVMEECYLGPSLSCNSQLIGQQADTKLLINITNRLGYKVKLKNITFSAENLGKQGMNSASFVFSNGKMDSGDSNVSSVLFTGPAQPRKNTVKKISLTLSYYICAEEVNPLCDETPPYLRTVSGRIVAQVN